MPSDAPLSASARTGAAPLGTVYGWAIRSEVPLYRIPAGQPGERGILHIRRVPDLRAAPPDDGLVFTLDEAPRCRLWRTDDGMYLDSEVSTAWSLDPARCSVACAGLPTPFHEHHLWGVVVPLLLSERGDLALHASAVAAGGRCVAFVGHSGRGKSTTAGAALCDPAVSLVSEEALVVSAGPGAPGVAWPGPIGLRLLPDAAAALGPSIGPAIAETDAGFGGIDDATDTIGTPHKPGLPARSRLAGEPARLDAICLLGPPADGAGPFVERLRPVAAIPLLLPHTVASPDRLPSTVRRLADVLATTPVYRVRFPVGVDALPRHVAGLLTRLLSGGRPDDR